MKRIRQVAMTCSILLMIQSGVMGILLMWFNRFSQDVFHKIPALNFRILVLYLGFILGATSLYTAYFYRKPGFVASTFFTVLGLIAACNVVYLVMPTLQAHILFVLYLILLSIGYLFVGAAGYFHRLSHVPLRKNK